MKNLYLGEACEGGSKRCVSDADAAMNIRRKFEGSIVRTPDNPRFDIHASSSSNPKRTVGLSDPLIIGLLPQQLVTKFSITRNCLDYVR